MISIYPLPINEQMCTQIGMYMDISPQLISILYLFIGGGWRWVDMPPSTSDR